MVLEGKNFFQWKVPCWGGGVILKMSPSFKQSVPQLTDLFTPEVSTN